MSAVGAGIVEVRALRKRYGATHALDGLDLDVQEGEILGVAGPNGAGKSTLVKILAAETTADSGTISINGVRWDSRIGATEIAVVHQEPELFSNLTILENLVIGREQSRRRWRTIRQDDRDVLIDMGLDSFADRLLSEVPLAVQQRTEIARALVREARVFLFDEPNSALTEEESNDLFVRMKALAAAGRAVIFVSHRLHDLAQHCDRVAIVRDGRVVDMIIGEALTPETIAVKLLADHHVTERVSQVAEAPENEAVSITSWTDRAATFGPIDLTIGAGKVVALAGVEGSGARELARSLAGLLNCGGRISVFDTTGSKAFGCVAYVSADRQTSLFSNLSIAENIASRLGAEIAGPLGWVSRSKVANVAAQARQETVMKAPDVNAPVRSLSGGNQQKVAISAAIASKPRVLVLEEPTRGVDIASKSEIYDLLRGYAHAGNCVVLFCTESSEIYDVASSAVVIVRGLVEGTIAVDESATAEHLNARLVELQGAGSMREPA